MSPLPYVAVELRLQLPVGLVGVKIVGDHGAGQPRREGRNLRRARVGG